MSTYGNFKFLIEGKFFDQPNDWCISAIGGRYGSINLGLDTGQENYFANSLTNGDAGDELSFCYYERLNLEETCRVLAEKINRGSKKGAADYDVRYSHILFFLNELKKKGLKIEVFYNNEYYECVGLYGIDTRKEDLESGEVKLWKGENNEN